MPFSDKPWGEITEADYEDAAAFCDACLIDLNPEGEEKTKALCKLPVAEPGGTYNRNGMRAAAAALAGARGGVEAPTEAKRSAARRLMSLMYEAEMTPGESLMRMSS